MAEIKKVWVVRDGAESDLDDPAIKSWGGNLEENILAQFMWEMDVDQLVRVIHGTMGTSWWDEHTKLYDDASSARRDAEARIKKLRAKVERRGPKTAAERVAEKFFAARLSSLKLHDKVVLPKGLQVGMGRLREDTEATVDRVEERDGGEFYGVIWTDAKGKTRHTYVDESDVKTASGRTMHLEGKSGHTLCGETAHKDTIVDSVKDSTCHYCVQAWKKTHGGI